MNTPERVSNNSRVATDTEPETGCIPIRDRPECMELDAN